MQRGSTLRARSAVAPLDSHAASAGGSMAVSSVGTTGHLSCLEPTVLTNRATVSTTMTAAEKVDQLILKAYGHKADAERYVRQKLTDAWNVCHFSHLPAWLQDNDYLHKCHRPPLDSFRACFFSIFRLHTETLNIWTHAFGCAIFIFLAWADIVVASNLFAFIGKCVCTSHTLTGCVCLISSHNLWIARQTCVWYVLCWRHHLSGHVRAVPYVLVSLAARGQDIFQARLLRHCIAHCRLVRAMAVLRLLLRLHGKCCCWYEHTHTIEPSG